MTRNIYDGSFKESENFVTDDYIQKALLESEPKVVRKRFIGVIVVLSFIIITYYFCIFLEVGYPETGKLIPARFGNTWTIICMLIFIFYCIKMFHLKQIRVLSSYYYNLTMLIVVSIFVVQIFLFLLTVANIGLNSYLPVIVYPFILLLVIFAICTYICGVWRFADNGFAMNVFTASCIVAVSIYYFYMLFANVLIKDGWIEIRLINRVLKKYSLQENHVEEIGKVRDINYSSETSFYDEYYAICLVNKTNNKKKQLKFYIPEEKYKIICKSIRDQLADIEKRKEILSSLVYVLSKIPNIKYNSEET